jgi:glycosyltransferase involved in cell wall biosynthesis
MSTQSHPPVPLLSICIPTNNRPETLKQTLRSVVPKSEDIEILVCDNSSEDINQKIVEEELQDCPCPWRYNRNNLPKGLLGIEMMVENFNTCVRLARGHYIYILHDDDYLLPGGLNIVLQKIRETRQQHHLLMFGVKLVNPEGRTLRVQVAETEKYLTPKEALFKHLNNSSFVRWPSLVIKREAYQTVGLFDRGMLSPTDIDMWARMFSQFGVFTIPATITGYTIHENTETNKNYTPESLRALLKLFDNASKTNLLSEKEMKQTRTNFIYRWILSGVYRSLKRNDYYAACQIIDMFQLLPSEGFSPSVKWSVLKKVFSLILLPRKLSLRFLLTKTDLKN